MDVALVGSFFTINQNLMVFKLILVPSHSWDMKHSMSKTHRKTDGATLQSGPVLAGHSCITSSNSHGTMLEEIELPSTIERAELWAFTMALSCLKLPAIF